MLPLQCNGKDVKNPEELQKAIEDAPHSEFIMFKIRPSVGDDPDPEEVASTVKPEKQGKGKVYYIPTGCMKTSATLLYFYSYYKISLLLCIIFYYKKLLIGTENLYYVYIVSNDFKNWCHRSYGDEHDL